MKNKRIYVILVVILAITALAMRLFLIFTSRHFVDGDESIVGLMAKHIIDGKGFPLFWYGIHYNGGGAWEAYLGALTMTIAGYSDYALRFSPLIVSMILFLFLWLWTKENFRLKTAVLSLYFYVFSVSFIQWNLKLRGHLILVVMAILLLWAYYRFLFQKKHSGFFPVITGLLSGLAIWCLESSLISIFIFFVFWFYYDRYFFTRKSFLVFSLAALVGIIPIIYENIVYNFANIKHLFSGTGIVWQQRGFIDKIVLTFSHDLPKFFHWENVHNYAESTPWFAWTGYAISLAAFIAFTLLYWKSAWKWVKSWFNRSAPKLGSEEGKFVFIGAFIVIFQLAFTFSKFSVLSPRYLLVSLPVVFVVMALVSEKLLNAKSLLKKSIAVAVLLVWGIMGISNTITVSKHYTVIDGFTESYGPDIFRVIDIMKERGVTRAYAQKFIKSRIIFNSKEEIIVSRFRAPRGGIFGTPPISLYPEYERIVEEYTGDKAYIFGDQPHIISEFEWYLAHIKCNYEKIDAGSYTLFLNFDKKFTSSDVTAYFINNSNLSMTEIIKCL